MKACVELHDRLSRKEKVRTIRIVALRLAVLGVILLFGTPAATLVVTVLTTLRQKPNVVFLSLGDNIQGTTDYKYFYAARLQANNARNNRSVFQQLVIGVVGEGEPGCIDVGTIEKEIGERLEHKANFALTAPKKPGVYYVQPSLHMQYNCRDAIKKRRKPKFKQTITDRNPNPVGVILVINVLDFTIYPGLWEAYNENVPNVCTEHNFNTDLYYFSQDFKLTTRPSNR